MFHIYLWKKDIFLSARKRYVHRVSPIQSIKFSLVDKLDSENHGIRFSKKTEKTYVDIEEHKGLLGSPIC